MRILRSYEAGESVSIDILRKQKRLSLTWKVPEAREHRMRHEMERKMREEQSGLRRVLPVGRAPRPRGWLGDAARPPPPGARAGTRGAGGTRAGRGRGEDA